MNTKQSLALSITLISLCNIAIATDSTQDEKLQQRLDARLYKGLESSAREIQQGDMSFGRRFQEFMALITQGADVNAKTKSDISILTLALASGNNGFTKFAVNKKADLNAQTAEGISPLALALMLFHAASTNTLPTDFTTGTADGYYKIAKLLAEKGAVLDTNGLMDAEKANAVITALKTSNDKPALIALTTQLISTNLIQAVLFYLVRVGYVTGVAALIKSTPTIINTKNKAGITPLHLAIETEATPIVELLINKGADAAIENNDNLSSYDFADIIGNQNITTLLQQNASTKLHEEL